MSINDNGGHEIPQTPPPAVPQASERPPTAARPASGVGRPIGIVLGVIGGVVLLGAGATAAFAASGQLSRSSAESSSTLAVDGIRGIDIDVAASDVIVEFGDVDEAELQVDGGRAESWSLERDDDELVLRSPDRSFGWWFDGWFGDEEHVLLTLPESLLGVDADIELGAGSMNVSGEFGELVVAVGAGSLELEGQAEMLDAQIDAGRAGIDLADVETAELTVSAGRLDGELTGTAPRSITFDVSAGALNLTVPDVPYQVTQDVSAGEFDNRLQTSTAARNTVHAAVSAGSATLRPAG